MCSPLQIAAPTVTYCGMTHRVGLRSERVVEIEMKIELLLGSEEVDGKVTLPKCLHSLKEEEVTQAMVPTTDYLPIYLLTY